MSLKIDSKGKIIKWAIWSVLLIVFLVFLVRVATFESAYYDEKEGSERSVAAQSVADEELDETEPTEDEIAEYTVAPDRPRYLTIQKLNITNSRVLPMGVKATGELDTPNNIFDVGWYEGSGRPGQGGTMIIDGHNGGPHVFGVFKRLPELAKGDVIQIERGDGKILKYSVVENNAISLDDSNKYMATAARSPEAGVESLTLISCTGEWSEKQRTYLSRQFVRAILLDS